jgi:glucose/arabinose dehydrogenase
MKKLSTLLFASLSFTFILKAQQFKLAKFSSGYVRPVAVENCGDSRLFVVDEEGKIFICDSSGKRLNRPYLDITDRVSYSGERGLLGFAFDPNYAVNGFFYVNYINKSNNTQISRFRVNPNNPNLANKNTEKFILEIDQPFFNHNGGCTRFGPDGYLYIGMGDGGSQGDPNNYAQNPMSLLGKMIRIDVHHGNPYKIPADNPFVDSTDYRHEIWALGLRNPWRWSFDDSTGDMYIGDVGQSLWEEVDIQSPGDGGHNYGWRCYEGRHPYDTAGCKARKNYFFPAYEYYHADSTGDCAITGGYVYRGTKYPALNGKYLFTDYCSGLFRLLTIVDGKARVKTVYNGDDNAYVAFGEDVHHELYVCNLSDSSIYHIAYGAAQLENISTTQHSEINNLTFSPNPSIGNINITYKSYKAKQVAIRITDVLGEQVYADSKFAESGVNTWNIQLHIPKGNYYLSVVSNSGNVITQSLRIE